MEILNYFINFIDSTFLTVKVALLVFLVGALSAYNSSRAIRISQGVEKRLAKSEAQAKRLVKKEKQSEVTKLRGDVASGVNELSAAICHHAKRTK